MKRLRDILELILLVAFIAFVLLLCYYVIHGARKIKSLGDEASATLTNLNRTIIIAAGAATNLEQGGRAWRKSSEEQAKIATSALASVSASAKSLDSLISSTNTSLNSSLLPSLSRAIDEQNAELLTTQRKIEGAVTQATATLADADKIVADPKIVEIVHALADSSKNTEAITASGAATMQKVQQGVTYEVDSLMKPVRKVYAVGLVIVRFVGRFFGF